MTSCVFFTGVMCGTISWPGAVNSWRLRCRAKGDETQCATVANQVHGKTHGQWGEDTSLLVKNVSVWAKLCVPPKAVGTYYMNIQPGLIPRVSHSVSSKDPGYNTTRPPPAVDTLLDTPLCHHHEVTSVDCPRPTSQISPTKVHVCACAK